MIKNIALYGFSLKSTAGDRGLSPALRECNVFLWEHD